MRTCAPLSNKAASRFDVCPAWEHGSRGVRLSNEDGDWRLEGAGISRVLEAEGEVNRQESRESRI